MTGINFRCFKLVSAVLSAIRACIQFLSAANILLWISASAQWSRNGVWLRIGTGDGLLWPVQRLLASWGRLFHTVSDKSRLREQPCNPTAGYSQQSDVTSDERLHTFSLWQAAWIQRRLFGFALFAVTISACWFHLFWLKIDDAALRLKEVKISNCRYTVTTKILNYRIVTVSLTSNYAFFGCFDLNPIDSTSSLLGAFRYYQSCPQLVEWGPQHTILGEEQVSAWRRPWRIL
jgi:hypothetical protein